MADKNDEAEVSWWDWAINTKEKVLSQSTEVMGYVQKDLNEFTKVISHEASAVVSSTATLLKDKLNLDDHETTNRMKESVSGFFNHVVEVFTLPPDDSDVEAIMICNQQPVFLDRSEAEVHQFYSDHSNFLNDGDRDEDHYDNWLHTFNIEDHQGGLSALLLNSDKLRATYTSLVPMQVNHNVFWHRYFYKMYKLKEAQTMRENMKQRLENSTEENDETVWDEDEEFGGNKEISELVQDKILDEYEKECQKEKGGSKKISDNTSSTVDSLNPNVEVDDTTNAFVQLPDKDEKSISPVSSKDTDESWDKLQNLETELQKVNTSELNSERSNSKGEDWENWE